MRLRQIALVSSQLDKVTDGLAKVFGLQVAYVDPGVERYGLRNAVLSCGTGFLEVVEPFTPQASASRFLNRRGGDAGYMVIIQTPDGPAERDRVAALGVRVVEIIDRPQYFCAHFHPSDFGGVLASLDQQRTDPDYLAPFGDWMPAGSDWRSTRTDDVVDMVSVSISAPDPDAMARQWSRLLDRRLDPNDQRRLPLVKGAVLFETAPAQGSPSICAVTLSVRDVQAVWANAERHGLPTQAQSVVIGGVQFRPVSA